MLITTIHFERSDCCVSLRKCVFLYAACLLYGQMILAVEASGEDRWYSSPTVLEKCLLGKLLSL